MGETRVFAAELSPCLPPRMQFGAGQALAIGRFFMRRHLTPDASFENASKIRLRNQRADRRRPLDLFCQC